MFPFYKLPYDIQAKILCELSIFELQYYSDIFSYDTIFYTIKTKFGGISDNKIVGTINNFKKNCYLCNKILLDVYNLIICSNCALTFNAEEVYYPELCQTCTDIKLKRGKTKFSNCIICNEYCTYLGISIFS